MEINLKLNGRAVSASVRPDTPLLDLLRDQGCYSVKRGCGTSNCGACTVLLDGRPVLSCGLLAARADGREVQTLEGLQREAEAFVTYIADQGAEQCGFCNPGFVVNTIAPVSYTHLDVYKRQALLCGRPGGGGRRPSGPVGAEGLAV